MHLIHQLTRDVTSRLFWDRELDRLGAVSLDLLQTLVFYIVVRFIINRIAVRLATPLTERHALFLGVDRSARIRTLSGLIRSVGAYALNFVTIVMVMRALRFDAVSVVSTASFAGLAVGFGAQKLVKDVINGFFIIMENQYDIGDYVTINTITGRVEEIGMRIMKIRDDSGKLFILSNGDISQVCNQSRGAIAGVVEIGVAPHENIATATSIIDQAGTDIFAEHAELTLTAAPVTIGIGSADATRTVIKVLVKVSDPVQLPAAQTVLRGMLLARLPEGGVMVA